MKLSQLRIDTELASQGVWVNWIEDVRLKICRINNAAFEDYYRKHTSPYKRQMRNNAIPKEVEEIILKGMATYILVDWENIEDENGNSIPYSVNKAVELLKDSRMSLASFVSEVANDEALYRSQDLEEDAGN